MILDETLRLATTVIWGVLGAALAPLVHKAIIALPARSALAADSKPSAGPRLLVTALALACSFAWLAWRHGPGWVTIVHSAYAVIFVIIVGIDLDHRLILNRVIAPAAIFALLVAPTLPDMSLLRAIVGAVAGFVLLLLPALVRPGGLGGGDVKLAGFLGLAAGFPAILTALATGIILGGVVTLVLLLTRRVGRRDYIPYGPFLIAGAILVFV